MHRDQPLVQHCWEKLELFSFKLIDDIVMHERTYVCMYEDRFCLVL